MRYFVVNESPGNLLRVAVRDVGRDGFLAGSKQVPCLRGRLVDEPDKEIVFAVSDVVEELRMVGGELKGRRDLT